MALRLLVAPFAVSASILAVTQASARELTFADRVRAEEAILRVDYAHQIGATRPFDEAVPRSVIEERVRRYLRESVALGRFWRSSPTAEDLRRELERIARATRLPDRLEEIFDALGRDPVVIQECLARPALVDRWARADFAADARFHPPALAAPERADDLERAWEEFWSAASPSLDSAAVATVAREDVAVPAPARSASAGTGAGCVPNDDWEAAALGGSPSPRSGHAAVWTGSVMIVWGGSDALLNTGGRYDPVLDTWAPTSLAGAPAGRRDHTAVWTGSLMVVWGGQGNLIALGNGGRYDPVADAWTPVTTSSAPSRRWLHTAVWTGTRMIVWGGRDSAGYLNTGGQYDPATNTWSGVTTIGAPSARAFHTAVWTGDRMVVFGGQLFTGEVLADGGSYAPGTNAWTPIASAASGRLMHTAVWTGLQMIVWGGSNGAGAIGTGERYDPATDSWTPVATASAPSPRYRHSAVWAGAYGMIVWGGHDGTHLLGDGARYLPDSNSWVAVPSSGAPAPHDSAVAVWTGDQMVVWGGEVVGISDVALLDSNTGGRFSPSEARWKPAGPAPPVPRYQHAVIWTGNQMIVWGGLYGLECFASGGRYDAVTDTWSPTTLAGAPLGRAQLAAAWTGTVMLVWGGANNQVGQILGDGSRYDPIADSWAPSSSSGAPGPRNNASAVWTGSEVLVWGGNSGTETFGDGARYDPVGDSWSAMTSVGAPSSRVQHAAVWTGSRMIVWGGRGGSDGFTPTDTGGRYDPVADHWDPTSTLSAPSARYGHTGIWSGSRLVVWGGDAPTVTNTGGRYDPATDTWSGMATASAPSARRDHVAVFGAGRMVVWGGRDDGSPPTTNYFATGGRYDPVADTWQPTSTTNAPAARYGAGAVWMDGGAVAVWGGYNDSRYFNDGSRYGVGNPDADADGVADACDCAPADPTATHVPAEVVRLTFADTTTLEWSSAAGGAGTGTVHDVLRGAIDTLPVGSGGESCLATGVAGTSTTDPATPAAGSGFRYLVRGRNACGAGPYGFTSGGAPESSDACP